MKPLPSNTIVTCQGQDLSLIFDYDSSALQIDVRTAAGHFVPFDTVSADGHRTLPGPVGRQYRVTYSNGYADISGACTVALPYGTPAVFIGDSITEGNTSTASFSRINGISMALGPAITLRAGYNQGVGGDTTADVLARMPTILAAIQPLALVQLGTNDVSADVPTELYIYRLLQIKDALLAGGATTVVLAAPPAKAVDASTPWTDAQFALHRAYLDALAALSLPNVIIDVASANQFTATSVNTSDGTHLNLLGAMELGALQAVAIRPAIVSQSPWTVTDNLLTNPRMDGTAGTAAGAVSGVVADDYTVGSNVSGATVTCSKSLNVFGDYTQSQTIAVSGTVGSQTEITNLRQDIAISGQAGDIYLAYCRFKIEAGHVGLTNINVKMGNNVFETLGETKTSDALTTSDAIEGVICTMVEAPLSGGETSLQPQFILRTIGGPVEITAHFDSPVVMKLAA